MMRTTERTRVPGSPSEQGEANLEVAVGSREVLDVRSFAVEERIDSLFSVRLEVMSESSSLDFDGIVGHPARFQIRPALREARDAKIWQGVCSELSQIAVESSGLSTYELTIVPTMWLLTQRKNFRVFQNLSGLAIATQILREWGVELEVASQRADAKRDYRVQYGETDHAFVCRMLEEAGIAHFFRVDESGTRLVLAHAPQSGPPRETAIPFRDHPTNADRDCVTKLRLFQQISPGKYTLRDHDTRLPPTYALGAGASAGDSPGSVEARLEMFDYAPGALLALGPLEDGTPSADDRGTVRSDEKMAAAVARARLAATRGGRRTARFETSVVDLGPGDVFAIAEHPHAQLDVGRPWLVVSSRHEGTSHGTWVHVCEARPAEAPYRPALDTPKPKVAGVESATVVGPGGEEIHTDEFGRVRVHFHWDRESQMNETSSPWIPVSQSWGGAGYGGSNLPRIGQEVIVDFLGGDPDRPVVVGRIYTNQQKTPYKLPENKTQSGWKSCSTNQTGGYNEIMFEDASGKELVRMQAEKDLDKLVKNDETVEIRRDRTKLVKRDDTLKVERDRQKRVDHDETVSIGHDRAELVEHDERIVIGNDRDELVKKNEDLVIGKNRTKRVMKHEREMVALTRTRMVGLNEAVMVGVAQQVKVGVDQSTQVGKNRSVKVGKNQSTKIGKNQDLAIGGKRSIKVGKTATETVALAKMVTVGGVLQTTVGAVMNTTVAISASEQVGTTKSVVAGTSISLTCGRSSLVLEASGKITMAIDGGASVVLADKNAFVVAPSGGAVILQGGPEVHLNP